MYWIGQGAEPSDRVHNMLVKAGVIEGKIIPKKMKRPEPKVAEAASAETETKPESASEAAAPAEEVKA